MDIDSILGEYAHSTTPAKASWADMTDQAEEEQAQAEAQAQAQAQAQARAQQAAAAAASLQQSGAGQSFGTLADVVNFGQQLQTAFGNTPAFNVGVQSQPAQTQRTPAKGKAATGDGRQQQKQGSPAKRQQSAGSAKKKTPVRGGGNAKAAPQQQFALAMPAAPVLSLLPFTPLGLPGSQKKAAPHRASIKQQGAARSSNTPLRTQQLQQRQQSKRQSLFSAARAMPGAGLSDRRIFKVKRGTKGQAHSGGGGGGGSGAVPMNTAVTPKKAPQQQQQQQQLFSSNKKVKQPASAVQAAAKNKRRRSDQQQQQQQSSQRGRNTPAKRARTSGGQSVLAAAANQTFALFSPDAAAAAFAVGKRGGTNKKQGKGKGKAKNGGGGGGGKAQKQGKQGRQQQGKKKRN